MVAQPKTRMTVDEFFAWADGRDGKWELFDGEVVAMSPERIRHSRMKLAAANALQRAIRSAGISCETFVDGVAVRIDTTTSYIPDVFVQCGEAEDPDALEASAPVIVVEVISPTSRSSDMNRKLAGYLRVESIVHYLVLDPNGPMVIHHRRRGNGIETRILSIGTLDLDPPGLTVSVRDMFGQAEP